MLTLQYSVFNPEPFVCLVKPTRLLHEGGLPSIIKTLVEKHCKELQNSVTRSAELYKNLGASGEGEWTSDEDEVAAFDVKEAIEKKIIASMDPNQLSTSEPLNVYLIAPRKLFQDTHISHYAIVRSIPESDDNHKRDMIANKVQMGPDYHYPLEKDEATKFLNDLLKPRWMSDMDHAEISSLLPSGYENKYTTIEGNPPSGLGQNDKSIAAEAYSYMHLLRSSSKARLTAYTEGGKEPVIAGYWFCGVHAAL
ncbi:hypothetical protein BT96DRAFT_932459 [Gymnopus androsaceus JB14]|uniref:Uncharacterized protein n=1 Tax=Gymnopus androsaceus JB14 TaxID=1447944 RepID=A0A6A4IHE4_9AGAR|nr:hypothetical protein BT96DRAFT_932459 [Gymnopus androsaceus JB14]